MKFMFSAYECINSHLNKSYPKWITAGSRGLFTKFTPPSAPFSLGGKVEHYLILQKAPLGPVPPFNNFIEFFPELCSCSLAIANIGDLNASRITFVRLFLCKHKGLCLYCPRRRDRGRRWCWLWCRSWCWGRDRGLCLAIQASPTRIASTRTAAIYQFSKFVHPFDSTCITVPIAIVLASA